MNYYSVAKIASQAREDVSYLVAKMSFGRRVELMKEVRELARQLEFLKAGSTDDEQMHAGILSAEIDRLYVRWGLRAIQGLLIDEKEATPETLAAEGPEDLFLEALVAVKHECGLSEVERKN